MSIQDRINKLNKMMGDIEKEIRIKDIELKKLKKAPYKTSIDKEHIYELEKELPILNISYNTLKEKRKNLVLEQSQEEKRAA
ncbi:MAG: hypothetical protein AABW45_01795 [Nanoarchaeota archaeon]